MQVKKRMAKKLVTVTKDMSIPEAIGLMKKHSIRHLPVVDGDNLIGFVTESDMRQAYLASLLDKIVVEDLMIKNPITISPNTSIEEAAELIHRNKIGGLPVVEKGKLKGILTVADILEAFIEIMGVLKSSSRIDVVMGEEPEAFEEVSCIIKAHKGEIISVGMLGYKRDKLKRVYFFRLEKCDVAPIVKSLKKGGCKVVSVVG
jgi:acetoin utilization protein AcuB